MKHNEVFGANMMQGWVKGFWINPLTGERRVAFERHNQLSYGCSDALASLMAGRVTFLPRAIGFIYGTGEGVIYSPAAQAPVLVSPAVRDQSWAGLQEELSVANAGTYCNMEIAQIVQSPQVVIDASGPSGAVYRGNSVIFMAHTVTGGAGTYAFPLTAPYAGALATGNYLYHAVLLGKTQDLTAPYAPLARITLIDGTVYNTKPSGFELSLEWQISFY